jgi:hypothetical protein
MNNSKSAVFNELIDPIVDIISNNPYSRDCKTLSDKEWIAMGIERVLGENRSGRGFLQKQLFKGEHEIGAGIYFEALKSERRLALIKYLNDELKKSEIASYDCDNPFEHCPELNEFLINLGDGHYHDHPTHEIKVDGTAYKTQHFYAKDARTHMMWHLDLAEYGEDDRKKEHDMRMLKRQNIETLKAGAKKGIKSLWVWDRACIDFKKWFEWKRDGIYFLTLEKESNKFEYMSEPEFDAEDPINYGVVKDERVSAGTSKQVLRRVTYRCPETKKVFRFITNLNFKIRPGVIAFLYKCRWDIEKTYNTYKHKFNEKKAWGVSETAKSAQANFLCLTHNLALIINRKVDEDVTQPELSPNYTSKKRKKKRLKALVDKSEKSMTMVTSLVLNAKRLAEIPVRFIVWLRETLQVHCSWGGAIAMLEHSSVMNL